VVVKALVPGALDVFVLAKAGQGNQQRLSPHDAAQPFCHRVTVFTRQADIH